MLLNTQFAARIGRRLLLSERTRSNTSCLIGRGRWSNLQCESLLGALVQFGSAVTIETRHRRSLPSSRRLITFAAEALIPT